MTKRVVLIAGPVFLLAGAILLGRNHFFPGGKTSRVPSVKGETGPSKIPFKMAAVSPPVTPPAVATNRALSREMDSSVNPYAGGLRQAGQSKRTWDADFLRQLGNVSTNTPIRFELTDGVMASGTIKITQTRDGALCYISGELTSPEKGKFFFLTPPADGKAGKAVGVVEFWGSKTAYRVEPTGPGGDPELWKRRLDEVVCQTMPLMDEELAQETAEMPPLRPDLVPDYAPDYNSNLVSLQSYPGSSAVLLLDFFGGYTPTWGGVTYPRPNVSNSQIKDLWKRVAEDYMPFNINVTTDLRVYQAAPANSRQRCVFSPNISAMPSGAAGVAYIGSWNWGSDTVCWSIYTSGKAGGEVGAHEAGHTVGLGHQGTSTSGYFSGQGSGATGWAPIMGAGYYNNVVSWAKGEYQNANNQEDELSKITTQNNKVTYRLDDTGSTLASSRYLEVYPGNTASSEGVIERTGDTDAFQFTTGGGVVALTAAPVGDWANLAISATLANSSEMVIASNNPQSALSATINTSVPAGTYTFRVTGTGRNSPLTNGFTSYGSLGYYSITGSVASPRLPVRLSVPEHSAVGTLVGTIYANTTNSALSYSIAFGNTGGAFSIDNHGALRVANNASLDYYRLATNTVFPAQFQLFVNINDLVNPALTEFNRRVIVYVLDVNDAPVVTGFSASVVEHTRPGTVVGSVGVRDADFGEPMSFCIVSGDPNGCFSIDNTGTLSISGDLDSGVKNAYYLAVAVSDNAIGNPLTSTGYVNLTVVTNRTPFRTGVINYAIYDGLGSGMQVSDLTSSPRWPRDPSSERQMTSFEGLINRGDNYGSAMRGYLIPAQGGTYTFWIASDDYSELWFSTTTNNTTLSRIAYVNGATTPRQWTKYAGQQSVSISLVAGQGYYIEARMKEGGGDDNLAVAWRGPATANQTNVISGLYLAPCPMNYVPHATGFTTTIRQGVFTGTAVGTVVVTDVNADDSETFTITSGNEAGLFTIDPSGTIRVVDEAALNVAAPGTYTLGVSVIDSGTSPLSATATATIYVVAPDAPITTALRREIWSNIGGGTAVSDLTNNAAFPGRPDKFEIISSFASAADTADNYGSRIRAYLTPTTSGLYRFFISSDDASSLLMSTTDNPTNAVRIAYISGYTSQNVWNSISSQISAWRSLVAGQRYYIEALQKEGGGGDHVEVAWTGPGIVDAGGAAATNIIDGSFLTPVDLNYPPRFLNQSLPVFSSVPNGTAIGRVVALDSPFDTLSFKIVDGNTNDMFSIDAATGVISVVDNTLIAGGTVSGFPLTVAVQDSGCGGLYLPRSSQAIVTITVQSTASGTFVWTGAADSNDWTQPGNWGGAAPVDGGRPIFGYPWQQPNVNNLLNTATSVQFTNGGFTITGNPISLSTGINNRGDNKWNLATTLTSGQSWVNNSGTLAISGAITNNGFPLVLTANGDVRISAPISGTAGLSKNGAARLILQGFQPYSGSTVISASGGTTTSLEVGSANLELPNSDLTLNGRMDLASHDATVGALSGSGLVYAGDLTHTLTVGANDHSGLFSGVIQNSSSGSGITVNLVKTGSGTQALSGANTYSGITVVREGTLLAASAASLGSVAGGTLVSDGATLALSNNITIGAEPLILNGTGVAASGALRNDYGLNTFNGPITLGAPALIRAPSGRLTLGGAWNTMGNTGTLTFDTPSTGNIVVSGGIEGGGAIMKSGAGTLTLNGTNNFTGQTIISGGSLILGASGSAKRSAGFLVAEGAWLNVGAVNGGWTLSPDQYLQGKGSVTGSSTILGSLQPGGSIGSMSFAGDLTLGGEVAFELAKSAGVLSNDVLNCSGTLTAGGTLTVTHTGPDALSLGDAFKIVNAASFGPGNFSTFNLPVLTQGLAWDTSSLLLDGTLRVVPAAPPTLSAIFSGSTLTLSWPTEYSDYVLQAQSNGLSGAWLPVPGVVGNGVVIPIDAANNSAFYRLAKP